MNDDRYYPCYGCGDKSYPFPNPGMRCYDCLTPSQQRYLDMIREEQERQWQ